MNEKYFPLLATIAVFAAIFVIGGFFYPNFLSTQVFGDILADNAFIIIAAIGTTFVILSGGIDLSIGSMIGFVGVVIANLDVVYSGSVMNRNTHSIADYSDYSYFYDLHYHSGPFWTDNAGKVVEPQEEVITHGHYNKWSNELRIATPQTYPVKGQFGVFAQRSLHDIWEQYVIPGLNGDGFATNLSIPGYPTTIWLTNLERVDRDQAVFGQVTWDIDPSWSVTGGLRYFKAQNSLQGFYGYSYNYQQLTGYHSGMENCGGPNAALLTYQPFLESPCTNLNQTVDESGHTERVSISYKFDPSRMVYATYSTGFRPGGVNRVFDAAIGKIFPPYQPD